MPDRVPEEVTVALGALAEIVYDRPDYPEVYFAITRTAVAVVPGCDHASISILVGGGELTAHGATSPLAQQIDALEGELREGPCYDAIVEEAFQMESDLTLGGTWPRLARRVVAETPVRGMIGYRIRVGSRKAGALNIFSETPGALDERSARIGALLAAFASVALGAASHAQQAETLRDGLMSNRVIGKATGLLMAAHGISDEEAFRVLRQASQELNIKLGIVAQRVLDGQLDQVRGAAEGRARGRVEDGAEGPR